MKFEPRRWLHRHSLKLLAIRDTPEAIAGGVAIGMFFGFMPVFGFKTLSAIVVCWLTRSNILAGVLACTAHDLLWPFMPGIYLWEYGVGQWLLTQPHQWPRHLPKHHGDLFSWQSWVSYFAVAGKPLVVGGSIFAAPFAVLSFFITRRFVIRHRQKRQGRKQLLLPEDSENPS